MNRPEKNVTLSHERYSYAIFPVSVQVRFRSLKKQIIHSVKFISGPRVLQLFSFPRFYFDACKFEKADHRKTFFKFC